MLTSGPSDTVSDTVSISQSVNVSVSLHNVHIIVTKTCSLRHEHILLPYEPASSGDKSTEGRIRYHPTWCYTEATIVHVRHIFYSTDAERNQ